MSTGRFLFSFPLAVFCLVVIHASGPVRASPSGVEASATVAAATITGDTLVVRAPRVGALPLAAGPATTTIIPLTDLAPGADLADVLDSVAGLQIRRYGGLGASGVPSLRGSGGTGIVIMVDGVPMSDAQNGAIDLASLPVDRFRSVEIHRGLTPAGYGSFGGAGAINLVSRETGGAGAEAHICGGSFGEAGTRLVSHGRFGPLGADVSLMLHGRRADNGFEFLDHNQTFLEPSDDHVRDRENAWFRESGAVLGGRIDADALDLQCRASIYRRDGGRPGPVGGYESPNAEVRSRRRDFHLSAGADHGPLQVDLYAGRGEDRLIDIEREVGGDPSGTTVSENGQIYLRAVKRGEVDLPVGGTALGWEAGGAVRRQTYDQRHENALNSQVLADPTRERGTRSVFGSLSLISAGGRVSAGPSLVWRRLEDDFPPLPPLPHLPETPLDAPHVLENLSPSLSLAWHLEPGRWLLEANWSRAEREPTWVELFGHRGGVAGNRELEPEALETVDLSLRYVGGGGIIARAAVFETRAEDTIIWRRNSQMTNMAINAGASRTRGLELELLGSASRRLRWWGNLTWQRARDRGLENGGKALPYLPDLQLAAGLSLRTGGWESGLRISHEAASFRDRYNSPEDEIPARTLYGCSLSRDLSGVPAFPASTLKLEIMNLTDDDVYDIEGFPLPGRSYRVSLALR